MISAILTCNTTTLTENRREALAERAQWVVLNTRNGRVLIDIIGERADLQWIIDKLTLAGLAPIVCAAWDADTGRRIEAVPYNLAAYLDAAADVIDYTDPDNPVASRPTTYIQQHEWEGWVRQLPSMAAIL